MMPGRTFVTKPVGFLRFRRCSPSLTLILKRKWREDGEVPPSTPRWLWRILFVPLAAFAPVLDGSLHAQDVMLRTMHVIGRSDGNRATVFGKIQDAAIDGDGRLFVLDFHYSNIRMFGPAGDYLGTTGRIGRGPGEFLRPTSIAIAGRQLYVLDVGNAKVESYRIAEASFQRDGQISIDFPAKRICAMRGNLLILGARDGWSIHEYSTDGILLKSFGRLHGYRHPLLQRGLQGDYLLCRPQAIVVAARLLPDIVAFSPTDGQVLWQRRIPGFTRVIIEERGAFVAYKVPNTGFHHVIASILHFDANTILVQTTEQRGPQDFVNIQSFLLCIDSGALTAVPFRLPLLQVGAPDGRLAGFRDDPFPMIVLYARQAVSP